MDLNPRRRASVLIALAACSTVLAALATVWPNWIESLGIDPDGGSGFLEWAFPVGLGVVAVALAVAARRSWHTRHALETAG